MTQGAGATESDISSQTAGLRDRDPPPCFDGKEPEQLKRYLRDLRLWRWETDTPKVKHAVKILRQLSGSARAAADEIAVEVIMTEEGADAIIDKLREHLIRRDALLKSVLPPQYDYLSEDRTGKPLSYAAENPLVRFHIFWELW